MDMKKIVLLMTVGTGFGEDGALKLAKGIFSSIKHVRPNFIVFFASEKSKSTIDAIKDLATNYYGSFNEGNDYEIVEVKDIDSFNNCFLLYEESILKYDDEEIIIDYTSGTKTMSAAMATCGMFYNKEIIAVGGHRKNGVVSEGTESIKSQNLYIIYDKILINKVKELFNANRFDSAMDLLNDVVSPEIKKEDYYNLSLAYSNWDNVNFQEAYSILRNIDLKSSILEEFSDDLNKNLMALGHICNSYSKNLKDCYILASLINNSKRRASEYKFDDAIARLYRSLELIAQIRLNKYGLISSDIDIDLLKNKNVSEEYINSLEIMRDDQGKIKIGLIKDFVLLNELNDSLGKYYNENKNKINNLTKTRNNSILAHGLESQSKETYVEFEEITIDLAKKLDKDMDKFLKETEFVKFS